MANKITIFILFSLFSLFSKAQGDSNFGYQKISNEEYNRIVKEGKEYTLEGKYYIKHKPKNRLLGISKIEYKKGKKNGEWLFFFSYVGDNIILSNVVNYKEGRKQGYFFETDGHTFSTEGYYKNNKKDGLWKISKDGFLEEINYRRGLKSGIYYSYDMENFATRGQYKKGTKDGVWIIEDKKNEGFITKETYKKGVLISTKTEYPTIEE